MTVRHACRWLLLQDSAQYVRIYVVLVKHDKRIMSVQGILCTALLIMYIPRAIADTHLHVKHDLHDHISQDVVAGHVSC